MSPQRHNKGVVRRPYNPLLLGREMIQIAPQLVVTSPLSTGDGYTWTLASQLGCMLRLAESRFGPRDNSYTILGMEFIDDGPRCWFPGNYGNVVIQLGTQCLLQPDRACFQLAHEAIHLLSPTGRRKANVLEEGLASHFQASYMANHYPSNWPRSAIDWNRFQCESYAQAKRLVEEVLDGYPDAIKWLRATEPTLSRITSEMIVVACRGVQQETAASLAARFVR